MDQLFKKHAFPVGDGRMTRRVLSEASPNVLRRWQEPDVVLALWQRVWEPELVHRLDALQPNDLPDVRFVTRGQDAEVAVEAALSDSPLRDQRLHAALAVDLEGLITRFAATTGSDDIEVRLEAVTTDACRRFHCDETVARLVTTYIGPGTVWIPDCRGAEAVCLQDDFKGPICQMARFAVGLFKGAKSPGGGLVHRSPRLRETGRFRLFLCLNAPLVSRGSLH